ncbi:MAG: tetratricopeptide repeat protein [Chitinophagales bacterium]|nr:tetratricopeptide repeat protein [Chitinophagales bacterium]
MRFNFFFLFVIIAFSLGAQTLFHTVRKGESIYSISRVYGTTPRLIADINEFKEIATPLKIEQKIKIPQSYYDVKSKNREQKFKYHTIKAGENYYSIGRLYGLPVYDILKINNIPGKDIPKAGKVIKIPIDEDMTVSKSEQELKTNATSEDIRERNKIELIELRTIDAGHIKLKKYESDLFKLKKNHIYFPRENFESEYGISRKSNKDALRDTNSLVHLDEVKVSKKSKKAKFHEPVDTFTAQKSDFQLYMAKKVLDKKNYKKAYKTIQESLDINPNNIESLLLAGEMDLTAGSYKSALDYYNRVIELDSVNYEALYNRSVVYQRLGQLDEAERDINKAIVVNKTAIQAYIARANIYFLQGKLESAIENYDFVNQASSSYEIVFINRGICLAMQNKNDKAIADFDEAIKLVPDNGYTFYLRGISKIINTNLLDGCKDLQMSKELKYERASDDIKKYCK